MTTIVHRKQLLIQTNLFNAGVVGFFVATMAQILIFWLVAPTIELLQAIKIASEGINQNNISAFIGLIKPHIYLSAVLGLVAAVTTYGIFLRVACLSDVSGIKAEIERNPEFNLRKFVQHLGFDPDEISELDMREMDTCTHLAIHSLKISRDYSQSGFSEQGIEASNKYLDSLMLAESGK
jgi:hypothetical protein